MKKFVCLALATAFALAVPFTSFAWRSKEDRNAPVKQGNSFSSSKQNPGFVEKGLPAPFVKAPEAHAVKGEINIRVDGEYEYFFYKPANISGRILLPFRELFELFDMKVEWNEEERTAVAKNESKTIEIKLESTTAKVNGDAKELDVPATIIDGRTYIPVRFVAESLEYEVNWNQNEMTVDIITNSGGGL